MTGKGNGAQIALLAALGALAAFAILGQKKAKGAQTALPQEREWGKEYTPPASPAIPPDAERQYYQSALVEVPPVPTQGGSYAEPVDVYVYGGQRVE